VVVVGVDRIVVVGGGSGITATAGVTPVAHRSATIFEGVVVSTGPATGTGTVEVVGVVVVDRPW
jgi:hypothetical protein